MEINMKCYNLESFKEKDLYNWEEIISTIENLESELKQVKEEYEEFKCNVEDNYERISYSRQIGE